MPAAFAQMTSFYCGQDFGDSDEVQTGESPAHVQIEPESPMQVKTFEHETLHRLCVAALGACLTFPACGNQTRDQACWQALPPLFLF